MDNDTIVLWVAASGALFIAIIWVYQWWKANNTIRSMDHDFYQMGYTDATNMLQEYASNPDMGYPRKMFLYHSLTSDTSLEPYDRGVLDAKRENLQTWQKLFADIVAYESAHE